MCPSRRRLRRLLRGDRDEVVAEDATYRIDHARGASATSLDNGGAKPCEKRKRNAKGKADYRGDNETDKQKKSATEVRPLRQHPVAGRARLRRFSGYKVEKPRLGIGFRIGGR